jgi:multicomponent Na+:H+ antiporter subunit A
LPDHLSRMIAFQRTCHAHPTAGPTDDEESHDAGLHEWLPAVGVAERALFNLVPLSALGLVVWLLAAYDLPVSFGWSWIPALDIDLAFRIDGLSALMLLMITGVGTAVFVYAGGYLSGHPDQKRAYLLLSLFMVTMIGCVTADHVLVLFVFWEGTSLLSFLLVGFYHERSESRKSAQQSLLVTGTGGLILLAGFIVLGQTTGSWRLSEIVTVIPTMAATPALQLAMLLVLTGAFTKSAQFPFHFWLPNAMAAPTPVSAYLHSATMVKLGVYLLARLDPGFGEWPLWEWLLKGVGSITAAWGMVLALRERDLKRILAWSTVATLGTLVVLVGLRGDSASLAVGALLLAHALYKAPLFFVAGNVDHGAGTRLIDRLGGLRRQMPWTAAAALLAACSLAGLPMFFGYVAKDAISEAKSVTEVFEFARFANTVFGTIAVAVAAVTAIRVFWQRPPASGVREAHEGGLALVLPPMALALVGLLLGVFPWLVEDLLIAASSAMRPGAVAEDLELPAEGTPDVGSLVMGLLFGAAVFVLWDRLHQGLEWLAKRIGRIGMTSHYERSLDWIPQVAAWATRGLQNGRLPAYVGWVVGTVTLGLALALWAGRSEWTWPTAAWPSPGVAGAAGLIVLGSVSSVLVRDRLVLLLSVGLIGYGSAVMFLFLGASDVAYTQFTVETVFVIVAAAVLLKLRRMGLHRAVPEPAWRPGALVLSAAAASVLTALLLAVHATPFDPTLSDWFGEHSVGAAFGRNVVNVILVDFRAMDTLGEIVVVVLSLMAALPLLHVWRRRGAVRGDAGERP